MASVPRRSTSSKPNTVACTARQGSRSDVPRVDVSDTHRLKSLEDENAKLKRLLADTMLDNVVLKDLLEKTYDTERAMGCSTQGNARS